MLVLSRSCADQIRRHGERGYPHEVCGALAGALTGQAAEVTRCCEAENAWDAMGLEPETNVTTQRRFAIDPAWILATDRELRNDGLELIGFYHTHPDHPPEPSETDRKYLCPRVAHVIYSVNGGRGADVAAWYQEEEGGAFRAVALEIR